MFFTLTHAFAFKKARLCNNVAFAAQRVEGETYLIMLVDYDKDKHLLSNTVLKFKLADGSIMRFESSIGTIKNKVGSIGVYSGLGISSSSSINESVSYIMFPISEEQIQILGKGIKAAVVNTIPEMYRISEKEISFSNFTKNLYKVLTTIEETDEFLDSVE